MVVITSNEDLRLLTQRRVPRAIFDYVDRGSYDEQTLLDNRYDLQALRLRQRVMVDVSQRNLACKPAWDIKQLLGQRMTFGNLAGFLPKQDKQTSMAQWIMLQFEPAMNWDDVTWVKAQWPGKLIIKGVLDPEDARLAVDAGADAVVVSSHGGRQFLGVLGKEAVERAMDLIRKQLDVSMALTGTCDLASVGPQVLYR